MSAASQDHVPLPSAPRSTFAGRLIGSLITSQSTATSSLQRIHRSAAWQRANSPVGHLLLERLSRGRELRRYTEISGFQGVLAGLLVALKQIIPETEVTLLQVFKLRAKVTPFLAPPHPALM